jgi:CheY-like chemotaxis protein
MDSTTTPHCNVLIADDEKSVSFSIAYLVKRLGCVVDIVDDGGPALQKIREAPGHYQILITDHAMMKMDGHALVTELKRREFAGGIIVVSSYLTAGLAESYRALGVDHIIHKPFEITVLRNAVAELMEQQAHAV